MIRHSGIGRYLKNIIPGICGEFDTILLGNAKLLAEFGWAKNANVLDVRSPIYSIQEQIQLPRKIPKCDGFWTPHYNIPVFPIRAKKRIVTVHDVFHLAFYEQLPLAQKMYARQVLGRAAKISDKIITVSDFSKSEILKYTNAAAEKISVIHHGIDFDRFKRCRDAAELAAVRKKFDLPDRFALFVGNVKPHKNLKRLILAFRELYKAGEKSSLVIVGQKDGFITGDNTISDLLESDPEFKKKVLFKTSVSDDALPLFYNLATVFIFPTLYEGFGFPPLEAMACGCPVITSNIDPVVEICGDASVKVDPLNPGQIKDGLQRVLSNEQLQKTLKEKGLQRVTAFQWETSVEKHLTLIDHLI